jgi:hypothetical protein
VAPSTTSPIVLSTVPPPGWTIATRPQIEELERARCGQRMEAPSEGNPERNVLVNHRVTSSLIPSRIEITPPFDVGVLGVAASSFT